MNIEEAEQRFRAEVAGLSAAAPGGPDQQLPPGPSGAVCRELFTAQVLSRHADLAARRLGASGRGYYSIGSSGHEGNVALALASRVADPVLPHYRCGAWFVHRARQAGVRDPVRDILLGVVAAAADPISGGRHKVFGSVPANIVPQTSTIASHLPRAVGLAFAIDRAAQLGLPCRWPSDAVVLCGFGDASANHATAAGAINTAVHTAYRGVPVPVLFVCEDNGIGISVPTPRNWLDEAYGHRPGLRWFTADGCDLLDAIDAATAAVDWVRTHRRPAFLRLRTVRLFGHAGSDVETAYRSPAAIEADLARDPLTATARLLVRIGACTAEQILADYDRLGAQVAATAEEIYAEPPLDSTEAVIAPLAPARPDLVRHDAERAAVPGRPGASGGSERASAHTLAQAINRTLADLLVRDPDVLVFGQDVARKGGVYGVTKGLRARFGARRVFDTLLDEQSILGAALGAGLAGFVPIPEIQYLAYTHNALDQLRGEAATLSFFSAGRYRNPMVVRIAAYAYQRGFGGHFHNDNSVAALRDIPGVVVASPARPDDAAAILRTCVSAARVDGRVCVLLEPIALYHVRDLHVSGDGGWCTPAADPKHVPIGRARVYGTGTDLTLVAFANSVPMCLRVARELSTHGIGARVLDLRWLCPLPVEDLRRHADATGRVLVADETRRSGGVAESVFAALVDAGFTGALARVTSADSFVPLGPAAASVLLNESAITAAAYRMVSG